MQINELIETPEGLYKKIVGLQAMLNDPSTTPGEKENAATLMQKIKVKLAKEFPNFTPQATPSASPNQPRGDWFGDMAASYGKAMDKEEAEIKRYGKPMNVNAMLRGEGLDGKKYTWTEEEVMPFVKDLLEKGKMYKKRWMPGYTDNVDPKQFYSKAYQLMHKWCPIAAAKRDEKDVASRKAAYARADKKAEEKYQAKQKAQKASGLNTKEAAKVDPDLVKRANSAMSGQKMGAAWPGNWESKYSQGASFFNILKYAKSSSIQAGFAKLDPTDIDKLYEIIQKIAVTGGEYAYTEAQKKFILNAIDVLKRNGKPSPPGKSWRYNR